MYEDKCKNKSKPSKTNIKIEIKNETLLGENPGYKVWYFLS